VSVAEPQPVIAIQAIAPTIAIVNNFFLFM
jgi:hypothetical protein